MCIGDLPRNDHPFGSLRRHSLHHPDEPWQPQPEHDRPGQVEDAVCQRRAFGVPALAKRGQHRRNGRADVVPQQHGQCPRQTQQTGTVRAGLRRQILQHRNGSRTALHQQGHAGAHRRPQQRFLPHLQHPVQERRALRQRCRGSVHHGNAFQQQTKRKHSPPGLMRRTVLPEKARQKPREQNAVPGIFQPECQQLCRDRGADVGAEDDRQRLPQIQQPCAHQPDHHHRNHGAALQHRRDQRPGQKPGHRMLRQPLQAGAQAGLRRVLQRSTHLFHRV